MYGYRGQTITWPPDTPRIARRVGYHSHFARRSAKDILAAEDEHP
jgi:hypothetical protein